MHNQRPDNPFAPLYGHAQMSLTTYRRSGEPVTTPVWFARHRAILYVATDAQTGKLKRIRRDPHVLVAPCDRRGKLLGPSRQGQARVVTDPDEVRTAEEALARKYGLPRRLLYGARDLFLRARGQSTPPMVYLAVEAPPPA